MLAVPVSLAQGRSSLRSVSSKPKEIIRIAQAASWAKIDREIRPLISNQWSSPPYLGFTMDSVRLVNSSRSMQGLLANPVLKQIRVESPLKELFDHKAQFYPVMKFRIRAGGFDHDPKTIFLWASYAKFRGEDDVVITFLSRINPDALTPGIMYEFSKRFTNLQEHGPELTHALNMTAYKQMLNAKNKGIDCDSARMQGGDTLLIVTDKYLPFLRPLAELSCVYDPSKEVSRYRVAADSILANYDLMTPQFKEVFFAEFFSTLYKSEDYKSVLEYFENEPLKSFPDSLASYSLDLASCSWILNDDERFWHYLKQAEAIDSVAAQNYWTSIYDERVNALIANPMQSDVVDWLLQHTEYPVENAGVIVVKIHEYYFPESEEVKWEWLDCTTYTPEQQVAYGGMIDILDHAQTFCTANTDVLSLLNLDYLKATIICADANRINEAISIIESRSRELSGNPSVETNNIYCWFTLAQAYIAGHGLDNPKKALKVLKKNISLVESSGVESTTRSNWYNYMAALSMRMGKKKDAQKYLQKSIQE